MKCLRWLCLVLLTGVATMSFAGDIQVSCEPALRVYLDEKFVGVSSEKEDGLFLANVKEGRHVIRVEKHGFVSQSFQVEVQKLAVEVKVGEFSPEPPIRQDKETSSATINQAVGNLRVTSAPQNCVVEIDGKAETKSTPLLLIEGLTPGEHQISISKTGYNGLSGVIRILPGTETTVRADLNAGKLETIYEGHGSLRVMSTPEHCTVRILGMTKEKIHAKLNLTYLPAGEHRMVVEWEGLKLSSNVVITKGRRTVVVVSFRKDDQPFVITYEPE